MNRKQNYLKLFATALAVLYLFSFKIQAQSTFNPDTVKYQQFDLGKMWTFEYAPLDFFEKTYGFRPSQDWLDNARLASPRFGRGCSSGFISEDGLLLTNHHCVDFITTSIQRDGENIPRDGFIAKTLEEERKVPNLYISQLQLIKDVTNDIVEAVANGKTDKEKVEIKDAKIKQLQDKYNKETGLTCLVTSLYHGGKYSLYGYKRYTDVRAVIFVERIVGLYGGDPDNYTYPRYNSDFAVLRIYDETGKPLKSKNYFKMNVGGPKIDEVLFALGYPGRTNRLKTIAQLEYNRDITYRNNNFQNNSLIKIYDEMMKLYPDRADIYRGAQFGPANSGKRVTGFVKNLSDPYLMARKKAYEENLKKLVAQDPVKQKKYGHLWNAIEETRKELALHAGERAAFSRLTNSIYFARAYDVIDYAFAMKIPEDQRPAEMKGDRLTRQLNDLPESIDLPLEKKKLAMIIEYITLNLGKDHPLVKKYFDEQNSEETAEKLIAASKLGDKGFILSLIKGNPDEILSYKDDFINYYLETRDLRLKYQEEENEIMNTETILEDQLGLAIFEIYGTAIPPDATGSLRINDATISGYEYNGTIAPPFTTFFGLYDRYYSHLKKWPWDLPKRWVDAYKEIDLSAQNNFVGTFDTAGGSSGSPIINKNSEYVGIIHDGNIEGLSNDFINTTEKSRSIALSAQAIHEIVRDIFKVPRIAKEFETGKLEQ